MPQEKPSILLVDDIDANLVALEAQLGNMSCDLIRASSGNEALRQLLKRDFAAMLLDVQMPAMDGYEVARYARENPTTKDVPIIFVTALPETEENALRGYGTGAVDYLFKPVNPYILRSKVQVFVDMYLVRRRLSAEIEAHRKTLAELEAFSYSISHDLRAPLRPLAGFSQVLLDDYGDKLDVTGKNYLTRIRTAAHLMSQLIDDLLRLSRISRSQLTLQSADLSALAESIVSELRANEPARDVVFVAQPEMTANVDPALLRIALENLLRNAWKFTHKRAPSRIEFGTQTSGDESVYFVRDNGVGYDQSYAGKLFKPFQRLHASSEFEGTGIGLSIVDRVIRGHGGRIWTEGALDQGATFFFTLPQTQGRT